MAELTLHIEPYRPFKIRIVIRLQKEQKYKKSQTKFTGNKRQANLQAKEVKYMNGITYTFNRSHLDLSKSGM